MSLDVLKHSPIKEPKGPFKPCRLLHWVATSLQIMERTFQGQWFHVNPSVCISIHIHIHSLKKYWVSIMSQMLFSQRIFLCSLFGVLPAFHPHFICTWGPEWLEEGALESDQLEISLFPRTGFDKIFIVKGHIINILGSVSHTISFTTIQHCFVPNKPYTRHNLMSLAVFQKTLFMDTGVWISCIFPGSLNISFPLIFFNH